MKNKPLKFQEATAEHVLKLFKGGQKRVLIGDEAGLGKTTVAAQVVERVKQKLAHDVIEDDGLYCIIYVCCNLQIAQQNIGTLCDSARKIDLSQSRLSMQHFVYHKQKSELKHGDTMILSLTPATSFKMTGGMGSAPERALIYNCLIQHEAFKDRDNDLSDLLRGNVMEDNWTWHKDYYKNEIDKIGAADGTNAYKEHIVASMSAHIDQLTAACEATGKTQSEKVNALRRIFAHISLETMKPDLVIMDEFQKFSSLLDSSSDSEESLIAQKFFKGGDNAPYILLLSATPYKPYTTLEEINQDNNDEQFQDFHRLMGFLHADSGSYEGKKAEAFKQTWKEYSTLLSQLDSSLQEKAVQKHQEAEDMLYGVMGRTERSNKGIIKEIRPNLSAYLTEGDIASYMQMRRLVDKCRQHGVTTISAPVDYTKSCASQLSFMENYKLKKKIEEAWKEVAGKRLKIDRLLLDADKIENRTLREYGNARLAYLIDDVFGNSSGVENLLWVPASQPYYSQEGNVFTRNADFSKTLVFSAWGMVPRMLSCLMSYECERRAGVSTKEVSEPLRGDKRSQGKTLLHTVSTWLAAQYDPKKHYGKDIRQIREEITAAVKARIAEIAPDAGKAVRVSSLDMLQLLIALDDPQKGVRNIHENAAEFLTDMAIGSPAICLYRAFREIAPDSMQAVKSAEQTAEKMISIFNNAQGSAAVNNTCKRGSYFQKVVDYCIKGNLQAVLDEFVHMIGSKDIGTVAERITGSFIGSSNLKVNTLQTFREDGTIDETQTMNMPKHFALDLAGENSTEKEAQHAIDVREAFNSPFRPFILSSTSVGQEGLDFHWYSRRMIHWNLPSNPQDLEQREGRINRFKCHCVRRNIAKLYACAHDSAGSADGRAYSFIGWNEMFERAKDELATNLSGMIPFWYLPLDHEKFDALEKAGRIERIERIVPLYPLSEDVERYDRLIKVLSLYRLTMGQPRQEDLVKMLAKTSSSEIIEQLIFQLSPFFRSRKCPLPC